MDILTNPFKQALRRNPDRPVGRRKRYTSEICAGAGFDWLLIDGEHAPTRCRPRWRTVGGRLSGRAGGAPGLERPVQIKQILDTGAQTLLVPMVQSAEEAAAAVTAVRYPPPASAAWAALALSRWNRIPDYLTRANDQMCVLVQIETRAPSTR